MKLNFTIDVLSASGAHAWRLQTDQSWRECIYAEPIKPGDAQISDKESAEAWHGRRLRKDKEYGLIPQKKAGMFDFLMRGNFAHAVLHRYSSAPLPNKDQMIATIAELETGIAWLLYLNISGQFTALDTNKHSIISNLEIAVRGEIASSGDYIGARASRDEKLMNALYHQFLAGWLDHLNSSNMNIFVPDPEKLKEEKFYISDIQNWSHE